MRPVPGTRLSPEDLIWAKARINDIVDATFDARLDLETGASRLADLVLDSALAAEDPARRAALVLQVTALTSHLVELLVQVWDEPVGAHELARTVVGALQENFDSA
ncbi:MAG: hypothetical protein S0880_04090 [Actinomycetota bacterium]|nr:hypothetical protein [Actinomycetota bacterium]